MNGREFPEQLYASPPVEPARPSGHSVCPNPASTLPSAMVRRSGYRLTRFPQDGFTGCGNGDVPLVGKIRTRSK